MDSDDATSTGQLPGSGQTTDSKQTAGSEQTADSEQSAAHSDHPLDELFERLRSSLGELTPEPLLNRMQPVIESFLAQFQLVPHREFDAHMANLRRLEQTVAALEARMAELETAE